MALLQTYLHLGHLESTWCLGSSIADVNRDERVRNNLVTNVIVFTIYLPVTRQSQNALELTSLTSSFAVFRSQRRCVELVVLDSQSFWYPCIQ